MIYLNGVESHFLPKRPSLILLPPAVARGCLRPPGLGLLAVLAAAACVAP